MRLLGILGILEIGAAAGAAAAAAGETTGGRGIGLKDLKPGAGPPPDAACGQTDPASPGSAGASCPGSARRHPAPPGSP